MTHSWDELRHHAVDGSAPPARRVLIELADPTHRIIPAETVTFTLPDLEAPTASNKS